MNDVINELGREAAISIGTDLDYGPVDFVVCSYGRGHVDDTMKKSAPSAPFVHSAAGHIFTDHREHWHDRVDVRRDPFEPLTTIHIRGDKGDAAALLGCPVLLFDDKERNLDQVVAKGVRGSDGVLVRQGRHAYRRVDTKWKDLVCRDPWRWPGIVESWADLRGVGGSSLPPHIGSCNP
jgi:hypothetical protein